MTVARSFCRFACERTRKAYDSRFGGYICGQPCGRDHPRNGAHVDNRSAASTFHSRCHGLNREKVVPQINIHALVPVFRSHFRELVTIIAGCVVHQHPDWAKFRLDRLYIKRAGFWLDVRLILLSFWITARGTWEVRGRKV